MHCVCEIVLLPRIFVVLFCLACLPTAYCEQESQEDLNSKKAIVDLTQEFVAVPQMVKVEGIAPGVPVFISFSIKNSIDEDIHIEEIQLSCGCMIAESVPSALAAKKHVEFEMQFRPGVDPGVQKRQMTIVCKEGKRFLVDLEFHVVRPLEIASDFERFVFAGSKKEEVFELKLKAGSGDLARQLISAGEYISCSSKGSVTQEAELISNSEGWTLRVKGRPDKSYGVTRVAEGVDLRFSNFTMCVPVLYSIPNDFRVTPSSVFVGRQASERTRLVVYHSGKSRKIHVTAISKNKGDVDVPFEIILDSGRLILIEVDLTFLEATEASAIRIQAIGSSVEDSEVFDVKVF